MKNKEREMKIEALKNAAEVTGFSLEECDMVFDIPVSYKKEIQIDNGIEYTVDIAAPKYAASKIARVLVDCVNGHRAIVYDKQDAVLFDFEMSYVKPNDRPILFHTNPPRIKDCALELEGTLVAEAFHIGDVVVITDTSLKTFRHFIGTKAIVTLIEDKQEMRSPIEDDFLKGTLCDEDSTEYCDKTCTHSCIRATSKDRNDFWSCEFYMKKIHPKR